MRKRSFQRWAKAACVAGALTLSGSAHAEESNGLNSLMLMGINESTGKLMKYDFEAGRTSEVGSIQNRQGQSMTGVRGMAYIPGNLNIVGFRVNPDTGKTNVVYINTETGTTTIVGNDLGFGPVTGAVAAKRAGDEEHKVFAIQTVETTEDETVDFDIDNGAVAPSTTFAAKVSVLGAAINTSSYEVPVTVKVHVGNSTYEPFGSSTNPVTGQGNVNDDNNARHHIFPGTFTANTKISVTGTSWIKRSSRYSGSKSYHWKTYLSKSSQDHGSFVKVLRDGDSVPNIQPFRNQAGIVSFVKDYVDVDTQKIKLDENQAIFLFELGTTNLSSDAADFQDLVVLVTLAKNVDDLDEHDDDDNDDGPAARLLNVNHRSGGAEQLMTLSRVYESLASTDGNIFYATFGNQLYRINLGEQTETLVGSLSSSNVKALEFANGQMLGFHNSNSSVSAIGTADGKNTGASHAAAITNMEAMSIMAKPKRQLSVVAFD